MSRKKQEEAAPRQPAKDWAGLLAAMTKQRDDVQSKLDALWIDRDEARRDLSLSETKRATLTEVLDDKTALLTETARERDVFRGEHATLLEERDHLFKELKSARAALDDKPTKTGPSPTEIALILMAIAIMVFFAYKTLTHLNTPASEPTAVPSVEGGCGELYLKKGVPVRDCWSGPTALPTPTAGPQSVESPKGTWVMQPTPHATPTDTDDDDGGYGGDDNGVYVTVPLTTNAKPTPLPSMPRREDIRPLDSDPDNGTPLKD
jgi:hypothetical protein